MMCPDAEKHLTRAHEAGQGANKTTQKSSRFSQAKRLGWTTTHSQEHGSCGLSLLRLCCHLSVPFRLLSLKHMHS